MRLRLEAQARRAAFALAVLVAAGCSRGDDPARGLLERARALEAEGLEVEAARLLAREAKRAPAETAVRLHLEAARLYHAADLYRTSLEHAEAALSLGTADPEALYVLGDSLRRLEQVARAESVLEDLLRRKPDHALGALSLGILKLRRGEAARAVELIERYLARADPKREGDRYLEALLESGRALRAAGKLEEAADRLVEVLEREPFFEEALSELAQVLYRLRRREAARLCERIYTSLIQDAFEEHVAEELRKAGIAAFAFAQRGVNLVRRKRLAGAYRAFRRALDLAPAEPRILLHFANLLGRLRRRSEARAVLDRGLELGADPRSGVLWQRALIALEDGEPETAFRLAVEARKALEREGDRGGYERGQAPPYSLALVEARAAIETGDLEKAAAALKRARALRPSSWETLYWAGRLESAAGRPERAAGLLLGAERGGGGRLGDLQYHLARALAEVGRREEARKRLQTLAATEPSRVEACGLLLELAPPEAKPEVEKALERARRLRRAVEEAEAAANAKPFLEAGGEYERLARALLEARDPRGFELALVAADLDPERAEPLHLVLPGLKRPEDIFFKLHLLRRLLALEAGERGASAAIAGIYRMLGVRSSEAERLAQGLEGEGSQRKAPERD